MSQPIRLFFRKAKSGPHGIQGNGAGFVPDTLDTSVYDEVLAVRTEIPLLLPANLPQKGVLAGISSGAALHAAKIVAQRPENEGKNDRSSAARYGRTVSFI